MPPIIIYRKNDSSCRSLVHGDTFVKNGLGVLQQMSREAISPREVPYVMDYFDTRSIEPPSYDNSNDFSKLSNALMEGMNMANRMPKLICFFFNPSTVRLVNSELFAKQMLNWLFSSIRRNMHEWKDVVDKKVINPDWPKIVIVKPIPAQLSRDHGGLIAKRRLFNWAIDKTAAKFRGFITMNVDAIIAGDDAMYTLNVPHGLSHTGWHHFWRQFDTLFRKIDKSEIMDDARIKLEERRLNQGLENQGWFNISMGGGQHFDRPQQKRWKRKKNCWKGSSWRLECVFRYVRYVSFSLIVSTETCKDV